MALDKPLCPGCGQPLARVTDHGVRYQCVACDGRMLGLRPFERLLEKGVGTRAWVVSGEGPPAGPCPFCGHPMRGVPASAGGTDGLAICRTCEEVWLPASVEPWLTAHAALGGGNASGPVGARLPTRCAECGAPFAPDAGGRCPYCRVQLSEPPVTLVVSAAVDTRMW
jgi:hypothetical protein